MGADTRILRRAALVLLALALAPTAASAAPLKRALGYAPSRPSGRQLEGLGQAQAILVKSHAPLGRFGGTLVSRPLGIWELPGRALPELVRRGLVIRAEPVRPVVHVGTASFSDELVPNEWWRAAVGADTPTPGVGKPVTVIDTGLDLGHPEFAGRPNTIVLNAQSVQDTASDFHGTAVASVVGAPANGFGVVGVYPGALLRSWDARALTNLDVIRGLDVASRTPGVINLSLGSTTYDPLLEEATLLAFARGSLIVAASGNSFQEGNPLTFPASLSHVLTVAATGLSGAATSFSSASAAVDLAAPGESIPLAVPLSAARSGYAAGSGTSFAAPIVAGAAAWVWTMRPDLDNTQLFDLMRFSARDTGPAGFDRATGFGILDIPAALARPALAADAREPNDDVFDVKPHGLLASGLPALTRSGRRRATVDARLDVVEDPEDVYRVWVPARTRVTVTASGSANVDLELWGSRTHTVTERGSAQRRDLIAVSALPGGAADAVTARNTTRSGHFVYVDVFLGRGVGSAAYRLAVRTASGR